MKSLVNFINESIKETSRYKKSQFDKDLNAYSKFIDNKKKLSDFLEEQGMEDDSNAEIVVKEFATFLGSSESDAVEDDDNITYEDIVNRTPQMLILNARHFDMDEDLAERYVYVAIELWNSISKCKIKY